MRESASGLDAVLAGSHDVSFTGRVSVAGVTVIPEVMLHRVDLDFDATNQVCGAGSATIAYVDPWGRSINPTSAVDWLAPYNTWLHVTAHIRAGSYHSATVLGSFAMTNPSRIGVGTVEVGDGQRVTAELITVDIADDFSLSKLESIESIQQSPMGGSTLAEIASLLGRPVTADVDASIPSTVEYKSDRVDAAYELAQTLGGVPYMRADNTVGIRPDAWPTPAATLRDGPRGLVISATPDSWDSSRVVNEVVVVTENQDQTTFVGVARITEGRLKYGPRSDPRCWGRFTMRVKTKLITTQAGVDAEAKRLLAKHSIPRAVGVTVAMPFDPRIEPGDVFDLRTANVSGRIRVKTAPASTEQKTMAVTADLDEIDN